MLYFYGFRVIDNWHKQKEPHEFIRGSVRENTIVVRSDSVEKLFLAFDKQSKTCGWIYGKPEVFNNGKNLYLEF